MAAKKNSPNKTKPTRASVDAYLASRASPTQLADCKAIMSMCARVTGQPARMWGPSIVGFGNYRYTYESGRTGEAPLAAFAIRGRELVVYLSCEDAPEKKLLATLGKHRMTKACLYIKRLADIDRSTLEKLLKGSIARTRRRFGERE